MSDMDKFLDELTHDDPARRQRARMTLLALDEDAVPPLVDAFYAGVNEARGVVVLDVVAEIGGPEALQLLEDMTHNAQKPAWQRWAVLGMARNGREDVLDTVLAWLQGGSTDQRQTAALCLGYIGGAQAETALVHALHDPQVAGQATRALEQRRFIEGLAAGYDTDDAATWQMVTNALLNLGDAGTLPLIQILRSEHPDYFDRVLVSLQNLDRPEAQEVLDAGSYDEDGQRK